ncbi:hydantoinase/oxoprolinase family protein [Myxosarcina sp. GI1]|uniref:hydantoinase/oxoprolinase family protein n=1 Tax=Myxosarcina sp. GI1 TaxID=1541065 RepID=UPI0005611DA6|nr:hydantoinase/oxoprolinase family protein [Myxosarcina sp. GI1]
MTANTPQRWQFYIDRGGTFTDVVAKTPENTIIIHKLLSENPELYQDAAVQGIREVMGIEADCPIPTQEIEVVKMGTTVATNALLERKGDRLVLLITKGFKDALRIGYQNRPDIFARQIVLPTMLYEAVIEVDERYDASGKELKAVEIETVKRDLQAAYARGIRSCAIVLMHGYRYPDHERQISQLAEEVGFIQISVSHQVSPLIKLVSRGDTTVVDAYLTPILRRYVERVGSQLPNVKLMFMKSDGGLVSASEFQGKDSILSGPAGGIVGAVQTSKRLGFDSIITFDMGGTSTDVAHFNGEYERDLDLEIAGARMRVPVLSIHTVAAGGGSILAFDGSSYRVGPESAGSNPGPACYRRGGSLTVTDANVMLGKIQPQYFPAVFGDNGDLPLDKAIVVKKFTELDLQIATATGKSSTPESIAAGFIAIAVMNMANAIKKISLQRGYDLANYVLCCFGGAGAQVACLIADTLSIDKIFIHPYAGVLSAYGIGLADIRVTKIKSVEQTLTSELMPQLKSVIQSLATKGKNEMGFENETTTERMLRQLNLKYEGTDSTLTVNFVPDVATMQDEFATEHKSRYGFIQPEKSLVVESAVVEVIREMATPEEATVTRDYAPRTAKGDRAPDKAPPVIETVKMFARDKWHDALVYQRQDLQPGDYIKGAAIVVEPTNTIIIEPDWYAELSDRNYFILKKLEKL